MASADPRFRASLSLLQRTSPSSLPPSCVLPEGQSCRFLAGIARLTVSLLPACQVAGNVARLPVDTLNSFVAIYLASRVVYNLCYIYISDGKLANLRSVAYLTGIGAISRIFIKAGNALS